MITELSANVSAIGLSYCDDYVLFSSEVQNQNNYL